MKDDSLLKKFLFRYFFITDVESLSNKEKFGIAFILIIILTIPLLGLYLEFKDWRALLLLCGIYVLYGGLCYPLFFHEKIKKQYGFYSTIRFGATYQLISKTWAYTAPGFILIILIIGYIIENLNLAFLIAFAFVLPFFALFFRINVFNDDSSLEGDEVILGYNPTYYGLLSLILGVYGYLNVYNLLKYNLNFAIILFCITMIFQILLLIPDKCNEVLFFEIRRTKGFLAFIIPLILAFLAISSIMTNFQIININNINLSFESIIRTIIRWGFGIILALFFVKKIKEMNNFKK